MIALGIAGVGLTPAFAQESLTLAQTFRSLQTASEQWLADDLALEEAHHAYERARALLYPRLDLSVPLSGATVLDKRYTTTIGASEIDVAQSGGYSASVTPGLVLTQQLPTAGALSATLSDTISRTGPGVFDPASIGDALAPDDALNHELVFGIGLDQPLYFGGNAFAASMEGAQNALSRAGIERQRARNDLASGAAELFYRLEYLSYSRSLVAARLKASSDEYDAIEREFSIGVRTRSAMLQAQLARDKARLDLDDADDQLDRALRLFRSLYGIDDSLAIASRVDLVDLAVPQLDAAVRAMLAANPTLQSLRLALRDADNASILYESENAPKLSVGMQLTYADNSEQNAPDRSTSLSGSVTLSANLADGGAKQHRREELSIEARRAELALSRATDDLRNQVDGAIRDLERNAAKRDYLATAEEVAAYELEKGRHDRELGAITDADLRDLELALETARLESANALVERNMLVVKLFVLEGEDLIERVMQGDAP